MSLSVGIVGLPNVGKSTLFNALLQKQQAFAANYPFATIEPNIGIVPVPDERLSELAKIVKAEQIIPATVKFVDIAGLVKGAAEGEGLGNKFLAHIREVSLVVHVLRDFTDSNIVQTGSGDPVEDFATIETELQLADLETLNKQVPPKVSHLGGQASSKTSHLGGQVNLDESRWEVIKKVKGKLEEGVSVSQMDLNEEEAGLIYDLFLLTAKPRMFMVNVGEEKLAQAGKVIEEAVKKFQENENPANSFAVRRAGLATSCASRRAGVVKDDIVVMSAKLEEELSGFGDAERKKYLKTAGVEMTGLEFLIKKAYRRLGLVSFLTAGENRPSHEATERRGEVRAWTIEEGMTAPEAAGVIHSDFEKHFINAKVCDYDDFVKYDGWKGAGEVGKVRQEGRGYVVRDGDVVEFVVSV